MSSPDGRPVFISHVPWHTNEEHDCLPNLLKCCRDADNWFCKGKDCDRGCHCPKAKEHKYLPHTYEDVVKGHKRARDSAYIYPEDLCDTQKCGKQHCEDCDKGGTSEPGKWRNQGDTQDIPRTVLYPTD